jgi:hypothetical protein
MPTKFCLRYSCAGSADVIELHSNIGEIDRSDYRGMSGPFSLGLKVQCWLAADFLSERLPGIRSDGVKLTQSDPHQPVDAAVKTAN